MPAICAAVATAYHFGGLADGSVGLGERVSFDGRPAASARGQGTPPFFRAFRFSAPSLYLSDY